LKLDLIGQIVRLEPKGILSPPFNGILNCFKEVGDRGEEKSSDWNAEVLRHLSKAIIRWSAASDPQDHTPLHETQISKCFSERSGPR
jgi:hypothetical protein